MSPRKSLADTKAKVGLMKNIYILHGWTYSLDKWEPIISKLKATGLNPIQLKVPGLTAAIDKPWEITDYVDWLDQAISKEKNKIILIGHSNGGRITLNFAIKYPEKIRHLIIIDSGGIYDNGLFIRLKRSLFKAVSAIGRNLTDSELLRSLLYKIIGETDYQTASPIMRQTMINLLKSDASLNLSRIKIPVTIIWGRIDTITPLSHAYTLHRLISNSELHIIEDAHHAPFFTNPEEVTHIILKTINEN